MAQLRSLADLTLLAIQASGTSEGAKKAWDTRGRGRMALNEEKRDQVEAYLHRQNFKLDQSRPYDKNEPATYVMQRGFTGFDSPGNSTHTVIVYPDGSWEHTSEAFHQGTGVDSFASLRLQPKYGYGVPGQAQQPGMQVGPVAAGSTVDELHQLLCAIAAGGAGSGRFPLGSGVHPGLHGTLRSAGFKLQPPKKMPTPFKEKVPKMKAPKHAVYKHPTRGATVHTQSSGHWRFHTANAYVQKHGQGSDSLKAVLKSRMY